ncbi:MAG: hydrogenase maturation protease [Desulfitobacterium hafniense]|nr:hydrogenase maturation protease [Desulfitobacterium hafniense]
MRKTAVLGIGNLLLRDDGIGVRVVQQLQEQGTLTWVDIVDGGTSTLDMLDLFLANEKVIIVDSLRGGHEPGTIYRLTPEQLGSFQTAQYSVHETQILDIVGLAKLMQKTPEVVIIGVEPYEIKESLELSPAIEKIFPYVVDIVEQEAIA